MEQSRWTQDHAQTPAWPCIPKLLGIIVYRVMQDFICSSVQLKAPLSHSDGLYWHGDGYAPPLALLECVYKTYRSLAKLGGKQGMAGRAGRGTEDRSNPKRTESIREAQKQCKSGFGGQKGRGKRRSVWQAEPDVVFCQISETAPFRKHVHAEEILVGACSPERRLSAWAWQYSKSSNAEAIFPALCRTSQTCKPEEAIHNVIQHVRVCF